MSTTDRQILTEWFEFAFDMIACGSWHSDCTPRSQGNAFDWQGAPSELRDKQNLLQPNSKVAFEPRIMRTVDAHSTAQCNVYSRAGRVAMGVAA